MWVMGKVTHQQVPRPACPCGPVCTRTREAAPSGPTPAHPAGRPQGSPAFTSQARGPPRPPFLQHQQPQLILTGQPWERRSQGLVPSPSSGQRGDCWYLLAQSAMASGRGTTSWAVEARGRGQRRGHFSHSTDASPGPAPHYSIDFPRTEKEEGTPSAAQVSGGSHPIFS